jgi:hypothetical protein
MTATTAELHHDSAPFESFDWVLVLSAAGIWGASFLFIAIGLDAFEWPCSASSGWPFR